MQNLLHLLFGRAGGPVVNHLQNRRDAERGNKNIGVRLFLDDLLEQIEGETCVGVSEFGRIYGRIREDRQSGCTN
jgi:hypothetical protein